MKEENNGVSKNWKRIFRKKWFFPAVYLMLAALILTGVLWYQNTGNQQATEDPQTEMEGDSITQNPLGEQDAAPVMEQQEVIKMPVQEKDQAEIVTKFYDYDADSKEQEKALVLYNNKYYQSTGVDIASTEGETFDVTASLSGTVTEVKEDPLLGNVVQLSHPDEVTTYYASLGEVLVEAGAEVKQGDTIGTAGENLYGKGNGTHVHFELRKNDTAVNPEEYFNQPLNKLEAPKEEETDSTGAESENSEDQQQQSDDTSKEDDASKDQEANPEDEGTTPEEETGSDASGDTSNENSDDASSDLEDPTDPTEDPANGEQQDGSESNVDDDPTGENSESSAATANA